MKIKFSKLHLKYWNSVSIFQVLIVERKYMINESNQYKKKRWINKKKGKEKTRKIEHIIREWRYL